MGRYNLKERIETYLRDDIIIENNLENVIKY